MDGLADRIREVAQGVGGVGALAQLAGVPRRTLGSWLEGRKPKPQALKKIADVGGVELVWLISGEGNKFYSTEDRIAENFRLSLYRLEKSLRESNPLYSSHTTTTKPQFDVLILERLARLVEDAHKEFSIRLSPAKISVEAGLLYNELVEQVKNIADADEVNAILLRLETRLKMRLAEAALEPGTGKRSAS